VLITFPLAGLLSKKTDAALTLKIGLACYSLFYLCILLLNINSGKYIYLLGILIGISLTFYALSVHILTYDLTNDKNRDLYYGVNGAVTSFAGILPPVLSGFIIISNNGSGLKGYYIIFTITLTIFLLSAFISAFLKNKSDESDYLFKEVLFLKDRRWDVVLKSQALLGLRDGIYSFIINIIMFMILNSEMGFGKYTTFFSILGLICFFLLSRLVRTENRLKYLLIGSIMMLSAPLILVAFNNYFGIMLYGLINTAASPFWNIPLSSMMFETIGKSAPKESMRIEFIVVREIPLNLGRILSILVFIFAISKFKSNIVFTIMLPALNVVYVIVYLLFKKINNNRN
jgi:YQGE family putative transporter